MRSYMYILHGTQYFTTKSTTAWRGWAFPCTASYKSTFGCKYLHDNGDAFVRAWSTSLPFFLSSFLEVLAEEMPGGRLEIQVRNRVGEGQLNEGCGAEWAQKVNTPATYKQ